MSVSSNILQYLNNLNFICFNSQNEFRENDFLSRREVKLIQINLEELKKGYLFIRLKKVNPSWRSLNEY